MIIVQAPLRTSLFGGGTDFPGYYLEHGGCVLTSAIDNLIKGAAGQAVQNMNGMFGCAETTGLE